MSFEKFYRGRQPPEDAPGPRRLREPEWDSRSPKPSSKRTAERIHGRRTARAGERRVHYQAAFERMNTAQPYSVVDDEPPALRRAMKATLTDLGYSVMEAKTGEEALEVLRHNAA